MKLEKLLEEVLELKNILLIEDKPFRPTELFNEGWLLRFVLDWFSENRALTKGSKLHFSSNSKWFSEAYLPSPFMKGKNRETRTHADGVIGRFKIKGKAGFSLENNASQFICKTSTIFPVWRQL